MIVAHSSCDSKRVTRGRAPGRSRCACVCIRARLHSRAMAERRQVPRYMFGVAAKLSHATSATASNVRASVLSVRGCGIEGAGVPAVGQECEIAIEWRGADIHAHAKVVWKRSDGRTGLKFLSIPDEDLERLRELCATLQLQPMSPMPPEID